MYILCNCIFLFFKKSTTGETTLTKEWDGHFLFNEKKKDVRVFNGVFPFYFVCNPSKLLILLLKSCFCLAVFFFPGTLTVN